MLTVTIDPGHGWQYIGKWSPILPEGLKSYDKDLVENIGGGERFREYLFNRKIAKMLIDRVTPDHDWLKVINVVPELDDISLGKRVDRINKINPDVHISLHANAIGYGAMWEKANGFSVWTTRGETKSDVYADLVWNEFNAFFGDEMKVLKDMSDGDKDYESNFYIIKKTHCPAILLEAAFYTNIDDVQRMMNETWQYNYVSILRNSLIDIYSKHL